MSSPQHAPESDDRDKQLWIYNPYQPWPMPSRRLQRVRPDSASLLTLPQELRDVIFDLVYCDEKRYYGAGRYTEHRVWERREKARRRAGGPLYVSPPFIHGVNNLMVSKAFFMDAASAFVKYRTPVERADEIFGDDHGIVSAYTTTATFHGDVLSHSVSWPSLPHLISLKLQLDARSLGESEDTDCVWWRLLTLQEIRELAVYQSLMLLEHLRWIEVIDEEWRWNGHDTWTPSEIEMWEWNLELFEVTVNKDLLERTNVRRPTSGLGQGESVPLYPGSKVSSPFSPSKSVTPRTSALALTPTNQMQPDAQDLPVTTSFPVSLPSPPPRRSRLLGLPQELRDTIFGLAFPHNEDVINISFALWELREKRSRRNADGSSYFMPRPFHKVIEFMVSKAFFEEAARAFVMNSTGVTGRTIQDSIGPAWFGRIFNDYTTKITIDSDDLYRCSALKNLTSATVYINDDDFEKWHMGAVWEYTKTDEAVRGLRCYKLIMTCPGFSQVKIVDNGRWTNARNIGERTVWSDRLKRLQITIDQGLKERNHIMHPTETVGRESHLPPQLQDSTPQLILPSSAEDTMLLDDEIPDSVRRSGSIDPSENARLAQLDPASKDRSGPHRTRVSQ
ncbi:hypothetical protein LTR74_000708 [Friedmanniomyces endolithicus]|nr:hypothetical protein LTR74_000708 [Friedmanniomyces endolithicus]